MQIIRNQKISYYDLRDDLQKIFDWCIQSFDNEIDIKKRDGFLNMASLIIKIQCYFFRLELKGYLNSLPKPKKI
jgi:hypothetical protein